MFDGARNGGGVIVAGSKTAAGSTEEPAPEMAAPDASLDPRAAAKAARLHYVDGRRPGITREAGTDGFVYRNPDGSLVTDEKTLQRVRKLAIPPAYTDVWICRDPRGHLQAVGRDARGRKQYRYHPDWRAIRDEAKYGKMLLFGQKLPEIRARVQHDLALPGLPREKVLATVVALLEKTLMRVGNEEYTRSNKSYGLTTLRNRHARVHGTELVLDFRAKHGIQQHVELRDRRLAGIVKRLQDISGQDLFQYLDDDDQRHGITSQDVNEYLHEITGEDITAKDFRTWAATNLAALALHELEQFDNQAKAKKNVLQAVERVSKLLGNTPAICRKCYIHPAIFDGYLDGSLAEALKQRAEAALEPAAASRTGLSAEEIAVVAFLSRSLTEAADEATKAA
jgi:DNA topoisomerase I